MNVKHQKYIDYIVNDIELPYLKYLEVYGLKQDEMKLVLSKVYNQPVTIEINSVYDSQGKIIYWEDSKGCWYKYVYDNQGNTIYHEDSDDYWCRREYDNQGNRIYYVDSNGEIDDNR